MIALGTGAAAAIAALLVGMRSPARRVPGRVAVPSRPLALGHVLEGASRLLDRLHPARRRALRDAQLPDALDRLASALRAGQAIGPAMVEMAPHVPDPLGSELEAVAGALEHGASVAATLASWAARPAASADVRLVAAALALGADAGGEVARAVDRVAATLRERRELQGEVRALATQARASAAVLAVAPLAFTGLVVTIEPGGVSFLVTTPVGLACLAVGLGLEGVGAWWMARITQSAA